MFGKVEFGSRLLIIEITTVEEICPSKVCLARITTQTNDSFEGAVRQGQTRVDLERLGDSCPEYGWIRASGSRETARREQRVTFFSPSIVVIFDGIRVLLFVPGLPCLAEAGTPRRYLCHGPRRRRQPARG